MSNPLQIALVAEGPTDQVVIEAALNAIVPNTPFSLIQIQPERTELDGQVGAAGWAGLYYWCKQAKERTQNDFSADPLFLSYDGIIFHIDADVAGHTYQSASITPEPDHLPLPCQVACPPARTSVDALAAVVRSWMPANIPADKFVLCVPDGPPI